MSGFMNTKRMKTDIERLLSFKNAHVETHIFDNHDCIIFNNNKINAQFVLNNMHPFRPPINIMVNNFEYLTLLRCNNTYLKMLNINKECLCCESLICKNNWTVTTNIYNLMDEIFINMNIKSRIVELIHALKIKEKYLIDDIPIHQFV